MLYTNMLDSLKLFQDEIDLDKYINFDRQVLRKKLLV